MFQDLSKYQWVLPVHKYEDLNYLLDSLGEKVIAHAESKAQELEKDKPPPESEYCLFNI